MQLDKEKKFPFTLSHNFILVTHIVWPTFDVDIEFRGENNLVQTIVPR